MQAEPGAGSPAGRDHPQDDADGGRPGPLVTGAHAVDHAVARLDELADLPVSEHPAVFEQVHRQLAEALGDLDQPEDAAARRAAPGQDR